MSQGKYSDFDDIDYLKKYPDDSNNVWKKLLNYLNDEVQLDENNQYPFWSSFIKENRQNQKQFFKDISDNCQTNYQTGNIYNDIKKDMIISLTSSLFPSTQVESDIFIFQNWTDKTWNDSVAKLMLNYYFALDTTGAELYETKYIYINEDGTINIEKTRGKIHVNNNVNLRVSDIKNADAGHYFGDYKKGEIIETNSFNEKFLWVIPWYNLDGKTYLAVRGNDINLSAIHLGYEDDRLIKNQGKYYLDFTREYESNWMRLLMPQYKRRIEVEDLNRNFWVIAQTISALTTYLFDSNSPYPKMIGGLLNEIMQIWENVLFMWSELARQNNKAPDTITKVVYISPENLSDYLAYDDFDFYGVWESYNFNRAILSYNFDSETHLPTYTKVINVIPTLNRATIEDESGNHNLFEGIVIFYLREYRKKFANKNVNLIPIVRLDNYEDNKYSRIICPGIYRYFINNEELMNMAQEKELELPSGEVVNGVFRTDTSAIGDIDPRLLNCYKESFLGIVSDTGAESGCYKYDISAQAFEKVIAGIYEKETQDGYGAVNYLVFSENLRTANQEKVYGLIKPIIKATSKGDAKEFLGAESVSIEIEAYDLARYFMYTGNKIDDNGFINIHDYIIYRQCYSEDNSINKETINLSTNNDYIYSPDILGARFDPEYKHNIDGIFGYYLGELISIKKNSSKLNFNVINLKERELQPSWIDKDEYIRLYGHTQEIDIDDMSDVEKLKIEDISQDEEDDERTLINTLKNVYDRWKCNNNSDQFWKEREKELSEIIGEKWNWDQSTRVGYYPIKVKQTEYGTPEPLRHSRSTAYKSYASSVLIWGNNTEDWKEIAWKDLNDLFINNKSRDDMTESTILFVVGKRSVGWKDEQDDNKIGEIAYAKDGLPHWRYPTISIQKATTGAAVRIPIGDDSGQYGFYPIHADPTSPDSGWEMSELTFGVNQIWRETNLIDGLVVPNDKTMYDDNGILVEIKNNKTFYTGYQTKSLMYLNKNDNKIYPRFGTVCSTIEQGNTNYFILRKIEDLEFNETNWLIEKNDIRWLDNICLYQWYKKSSNVKGAVLFQSQFSDTEETSPNKLIYAKETVGALDSLYGIENFLKEYYKHTYQKYVWWWIENNLSDSEKIDENKNLQWFYNKLDLENKLFGWIRIMSLNGNEIYTIKMPYNNPKEHIIINSEKNEKDIITRLREKDTFAGKIVDEKWDEGHSDLNYTDLYNLISYLGGDTSNLNNCIYMGSFCKKYSGSPHTSNGNTRTYYEDRIMGFYTGIQTVTQRDLIYKNQVEDSEMDIRSDFIKAMETQFFMHNDLWYAPNVADMYRKIAVFITPQDNDEYNRDSYTFRLVKPNQKSDDFETIILKDKILVNPLVCHKNLIYVFGPEENGKYKYGRRGIYRYPFNSIFVNEKNIEASNWIKANNPELFGKWPDRPIDRTQNTATNWKDDYYLTGYDIDEMRNNYLVISQVNKGENYEIYKSRCSEIYDDTYKEGCTYFGINSVNDDLDADIWEYPTQEG